MDSQHVVKQLSKVCGLLSKPVDAYCREKIFACGCAIELVGVPLAI